MSDLRNVVFDPEKDLPTEALTEWRAAVAAGEAARDEAIAAKRARKKVDWRGSVWSTFKLHMLEYAYHGKCGYCETKVTAGFYGDADHWRPKGAVTTLSDAGKRIPIKHPGYYWLAYCWQNIVPSCERCNSGGKSTHFPTERAHRTSHVGNPQPGELDSEEKPLILHPLSKTDPPEDHIGFTEFGQAFAINDSPLGENSIRVYGLARLEADRLKRQRESVDAVKRAVKRASSGTPFERSIPEWVGPHAEYSRAVLAFAHTELRESLAKQREKLKRAEAIAAGAPAVRPS